MSDITRVVEIGDWVVRQRIPEGIVSQRTVLLLHGWTGDEDSMWIFASRLPKNYVILAPRGINKTPLGGYGWEKRGAKSWPHAADFQDAIQALFDLQAEMAAPEINAKQIDLLGFSQGAALAYTMLLKYPERINKVAGLSGFLPTGLEDEIEAQKLSGKQVFVSHGLRDEMVPVDKARRVVKNLKAAGAEVIYCEEDVGHKLSAGCFRAMDDYFNPDARTN